MRECIARATSASPWSRAATANASAAGTTAPTSTKKDFAGAALPTYTATARNGPMRRSARWFALAAAVVVADQLVKAIVLAFFSKRPPQVQVTDFFNLVLALNKGAAFSILRDASGWQTPVLIVFALAAAVLVIALIVRSPERRMLCTGLALILGGAVGNVIDRMRLGHVIDFLDFHVAGWHWPAFNVADSAITVGAALLILEGFMHHEGRPRASL